MNGLLQDSYNKLKVLSAVEVLNAPALDDLEEEIVQGIDDDEYVKSKDIKTQDKDPILERDEVEDAHEAQQA